MSTGSTTVDPSQFPPGYLEQNNGYQLINVAIVFGVLEPFFFTLFLISRFLNKTANGVDFYLMPFAFLFCFSHIPLAIVWVNAAGAGRHYVTVSAEQFVLWNKLIFAEEFTYIVSTAFPKLAILALYMRVFTTRFYRWTVYVLATIILLTVVVDFVLALVICKPVAYNWDFNIPGGYCADKMGPYRWISIPNIVTDLVMLVLPLPVIWRLQTRRTNKIGLTVTFLTGLLGIITSILRFVTFFTIDLFSDPTFNVSQTMAWTCVEPGVYFIAACLPSLRPLLRLVFEKLHLTKAPSRLTTSIGRGRFGGGSRGDTQRSDEVKLSESGGRGSRMKGGKGLGGFSILRETSIEVEHESKENYGGGNGEEGDVRGEGTERAAWDFGLPQGDDWQRHTKGARSEFA